MNALIITIFAAIAACIVFPVAVAIKDLQNDFKS